LSKIEAEEILRQAIKTIKTASTGDQAAELLAGILEDFPSLSPTSAIGRQRTLAPLGTPPGGP
jgi:hypothetical protein